MKTKIFALLALFSCLSRAIAELTYRQTLELWDSLREAGVTTKSLPEWCREMNALTGSNSYSAGFRDGLWIRFYTRGEQIFGDATPLVMIAALVGIFFLSRRYLRAPLQQLLATPAINRGNTPPAEASNQSTAQTSMPTITPGAFFLCVVMALPAVLAAKVVTHGLFDPFIAGFYGGSNTPADETYLFLTQFVSCALGGFVFVWVGALCTQKMRSFSVWFFATFAVLAALGLGDMNGIMGLVGQIIGAFGAAFLFWKR